MMTPSPCDECEFYADVDGVTFYCRYAMEKKNRADFTCPRRPWPYVRVEK